MKNGLSPGRLIPGVLLCGAVVGASIFFSRLAGEWILDARGLDPTGRSSPISAVTIAVLVGLVIRNTIGVASRFEPGIALSMKKLLRIGIVFVGLKLSLLELAKFGAIGLPVVAAVVILAIVIIRPLSRLFGVSDALGTLTAAATSICGVTAAVATAPAIEADERELAYTVANVTLFGLLAMLTYPYLASLMFASSEVGAGIFLGTGIHDTSQVLGAALAYRDLYGAEEAFQVATITKLTRNLFIIVVIPYLAWQHRKRRETTTQVSVRDLVPLFLLGFLLAVALRTSGDLFFADEPIWTKSVSFLADRASTFLLAMALAGVGLSTDIRKLRRLGWRPFWLGATAAVVVAALGLTFAYVVSSVAPSMLR